MKNKNYIITGVVVKLATLFYTIWLLATNESISTKYADFALYTGMSTIGLGLFYYTMAILAKWDKTKVKPIEDGVIVLITFTYIIEFLAVTLYKYIEL